MSVRAERSTRRPPAGRAKPDPAADRRREELVLSFCEGLIDISATLFGVSSKEVRQSGRSALGIARVRQIAMYVAHTLLGLTMAEVGRGFGRDRTTVLHACHLVEDLRDDLDFDRHVALVERVALSALRQRLEP